MKLLAFCPHGGGLAAAGLQILRSTVEQHNGHTIEEYTTAFEEKTSDRPSNCALDGALALGRITRN